MCLSRHLSAVVQVDGSGHGQQPDEGLLRPVDHQPSLRDRSTAARRGNIRNLCTAGTAIPDAVPDGLSRAFAEDAVKRKQWESFKRDLGVDPGPLDGVVGALKAFLIPAAAAARDGGGPDGGQR